MSTRYYVHVFTPQSAAALGAEGHGFPENSFPAANPQEVAKIVENCSSPIAGIVQIVVEIVQEP